MRKRINEEYFEWLFDLACKNRFSSNISFRKLLSYLHNYDFRYSIPMDQNRDCDGRDLRWRFVYETKREEDYEYILDMLDYPCASVLEVLIALAIYCEESIMDDPNIGDRTGQWFWNMINNLGLGGMTDNRFDRRYADEVICRFLDRDYEPNGQGGLFTVYDCDRDLRDMEIIHQLYAYLNSIT